MLKGIDEMSEENKSHETGRAKHLAKKGHRCEAMSKQTGERCANFVKTPCKNGRYLCRFHGGKAGIKDPTKLKGNKNSVKTHEHESIYAHLLDEKEKEIYDVVTWEKRKSLEEQLKIITIREIRMIEKINQYRKEGEYVSQVTTSVKNMYTSDGEINTVQSSNIEMMIRIEEALTRVQAQKSKIIDQLLKLDEKDSEVDSDNILKAYLESLEKMGE